MPRHTIQFERSIQTLKQLILGLGALVEESVEKGVRSLLQKDPVLGQQVVDDDEKIDQKEVDIEEECLKLLALYQPVANDLRLIVSILKINNDLERIGDLAVNIAERALHLANQDDVDIPEPFEEMARKTIWMLNRSMDVLITQDLALAHQVCIADDQVDDMNREMYKRIEKGLKSDPERAATYIQILSAGRYLERIADHATNICEDVIYLVQGRIVRHKKEALNPQENKTNGTGKS